MSREAPPAAPEPPLWKRLAWFVGLWAVSVAAIGAVASLIRLWVH